MNNTLTKSTYKIKICHVTKLCKLITSKIFCKYVSSNQDVTPIIFHSPSLPNFYEDTIYYHTLPVIPNFGKMQTLWKERIKERKRKQYFTNTWFFIFCVDYAWSPTYIIFSSLYPVLVGFMDSPLIYRYDYCGIITFHNLYFVQFYAKFAIHFSKMFQTRSFMNILSLASKNQITSSAKCSSDNVKYLYR